MSEGPTLTRIIVFEVHREDQAQVARILGEAIAKHVAPRAGFRGARILVSEDGRRVINQAEWDDEASWLAMEADAATGAAVAPAFRLAQRTDLRTFRVIREIPSHRKGSP